MPRAASTIGLQTQAMRWANRLQCRQKAADCKRPNAPLHGLTTYALLLCARRRQTIRPLCSLCERAKRSRPPATRRRVNQEPAAAADLSTEQPARPPEDRHPPNTCESPILSCNARHRQTTKRTCTRTFAAAFPGLGGVACPPSLPQAIARAGERTAYQVCCRNRVALVWNMPRKSARQTGAQCMRACQPSGSSWTRPPCLARLPPCLPFPMTIPPAVAAPPQIRP